MQYARFEHKLFLNRVQYLNSTFLKPLLHFEHFGFKGVIIRVQFDNTQIIIIYSLGTLYLTSLRTKVVHFFRTKNKCREVCTLVCGNCSMIPSAEHYPAAAAVDNIIKSRILRHGFCIKA